ncbi:RidA family protein [Tomitella cavernea]|uniref:RidA family protein n=1 Tax=Tomitella cavernea TaxID=1387982 RepID=A0ABP9CHN5_9ACTN|nr:RidA family protein [Tomitella cavernea]
MTAQPDTPADRSPAAGDPHPYSPAYAAGGFAFVSGALSVDAAGNAVPGRTEALDAAVERMTERLATVGGRRDQVVKLTYFVTDLSLREEANRQFERLFTAPRPARTFLEVSALPYGATVEIDCIAHLDG